MNSYTITPIIAQENIDKFKSYIDSSNKIVITAHMSPDGDAIGSTSAMEHYLKLKGKNATIVLNDHPGDNLLFIPETNHIVYYDANPKAASALISEADCVICMDFNTPTRMGDMAKCVMENKCPKLLVDHHLDPDTEYFDVIISESSMCATCELVFRIIDQIGDTDLIDKDLAACIYTGMMTDTGMFFYNSSQPETYLIISSLLRTGFDKETIHREFTAETERRMRLKGYILGEKMKVLYNYSAAYFTLSQAEMKKFNHQKGDSEGFVNMPLDMKAIQCSAFFREEKNFIKVSLRSKGDFPVNQIAEKFYNGGGHKNAAGGEFYGSLAQAEQLFVKILPLFAKK